MDEKCSWCWIPILSENVFDEQEDFRKKLTSRDGDQFEDSIYKFEIDEPAENNSFATIRVTIYGQPSISGPDANEHVVTIDMLDESGLCRLTYKSSDRDLVKIVWNKFKSRLDNCPCTNYVVLRWIFPHRILTTTR